MDRVIEHSSQEVKPTQENQPQQPPAPQNGVTLSTQPETMQELQSALNETTNGSKKLKRTPEQVTVLRQRAEELKDQGFQRAEIAEMLGVTPKTLDHWFYDRPQVTDQEIQRQTIADMYTKGMNIVGIAQKLGLNEQAVGDIVRRMQESERLTKHATLQQQIETFLEDDIPTSVIARELNLGRGEVRKMKSRWRLRKMLEEQREIQKEARRIAQEIRSVKRDQQSQETHTTNQQLRRQRESTSQRLIEILNSTNLELQKNDAWTELVTLQMPNIQELIRRRLLKFPTAKTSDLESQALEGFWQATLHYNPDPNLGTFYGYMRAWVENYMNNVTDKITRQAKRGGAPESLEEMAEAKSTRVGESDDSDIASRLDTVKQLQDSSFDPNTIVGEGNERIKELLQEQGVAPQDISILLLRLENFKWEDVAKILHLSDRTVRVHLTSLLSKIQSSPQLLRLLTTDQD